MKKFLSLFFAAFFAFAGTAHARTFPDVSATHKNYEAIAALSEQGIIGGYPDGTFQPDKLINRVESLKIILLSLDYVISEAVSELPFPDTPATEWYAPYLKAAYDGDIVKGYPEGDFRPTNTVNLVESLKIVTLAGEIDPNTLYADLTEKPYNDVPVNEWFSKYMQYAKDHALLDSDRSGNVYPAKDMSRGDLVEIMYRLYFQEDASSGDGEDEWFTGDLDVIDENIDVTGDYLDDVDSFDPSL